MSVADWASGTAPSAPGSARPSAVIKAQPEHFQVSERLGFALDGHGEHTYFRVRKRGLNTLDVARALADACRVQLADVGFAGLKDRHAVTEQWFSVAAADGQWPLAMGDVTCLEVARHSRKLRRGMHAGNDFVIRLSQVTLAEQLIGHLHELSRGFPNYFGPQRVSAGNVEQARRWLADRALGPEQAPRRSGRRGRRRARDGWHRSVLRSMLFNAVLDRRVSQQCWRELIEGDVAYGEFPTGPLWGRGRSSAQGAAAHFEQQALAPFGEICGGLEYAGLQQDRRSLVAVPENLMVDTEDDGLIVRFSLVPGAYATVMLAAACDVVDARGAGGMSDE